MQDVFSRNCLWKRPLPRLSRLRPCGEEAGSGGAAAGGDADPTPSLRKLAQLIKQEAARLPRSGRAALGDDEEGGSGSSSDEAAGEERPWPAAVLREAEQYLARLLDGVKLAGKTA